MDAWRSAPDGLAFVLALLTGLVAGWAGGGLAGKARVRLRRWGFPPRSAARLRLAVGLWLGGSVAALLLSAAEIEWLRAALQLKLVVPAVLVWGLLIAVDLAWEKYGRRHARTRPGFSAMLLLVRRIGRILVIAAFVAFVLDRMGMPLGGVFVASGAIGAAVAFAARAPMENLFGFMNLVADPPFLVGDSVRISHVRGGPETLGRVQRIGLQSTVIQVKGRSLVSLPNALLTGSMRVENLSARDRRRLRLSLAVPERVSSSDLEKLCEGVEASLEALPQRDPGRPARVWLSGASGEPRLELQVWLGRPERDLRREAERHALIAVQRELDRWAPRR